MTSKLNNTHLWCIWAVFCWWKPVWESMATRTLGKINGRLRFLYRKQNFLDSSLCRLLANTLIQPHFNYACSAWFPLLNKRLTNKIQTAQNKCIRLCRNLNNRAHIGTKEFKDINWLPTKERFEQCTATNVFKFFDNTTPSYMSEVFSLAGRIKVTLRSKNKLEIPFRESNTGQNGLSYLGPKIWNTLDSELESARNVNNFKKKRSKANSLKTSILRKLVPVYSIKILKAATKWSINDLEGAALLSTFELIDIYMCFLFS